MQLYSYTIIEKIQHFKSTTCRKIQQPMKIMRAVSRKSYTACWRVAFFSFFSINLEGLSKIGSMKSVAF